VLICLSLRADGKWTGAARGNLRSYGKNNFNLGIEAMLERLPIKRKLQAVMMLTAALALGFACVAFIVYEVQRFRRSERESMMTLARVTADSCAALLAFSNKREGTNALSMLSAESHVLAAALYDNSGALFAVYRAPASQPIASTPPSDGLYRADSHWDFYYPVRDRGERDGTVLLRWNLEPMYGALWFYTGIAGLVLLGSLVLAYFLGGRLQKTIAEPILGLAETAKAVAVRNDYSVRAQKFSEDELGMLTTAFNQMLSEIQRNESALRDSQAVLRTVTNEAQVGLVMVNREHRYRFANQTYADILGLPDADILGRRIADVLPQVYETQIRPRLDAAFGGQRVSYELHLPVHSRTHDERFYDVVYEPRISCTDEPYVVVVIVDITERKKAHQLLEKTVEERTAELRETIGYLETFSYSITHDMRGPLRAMNSFARLLADEVGPQLNDEQRDYIRRISDGAKRLDRLIQDVLSYSRVAKSEMPLGPVPLHSLLKDIIEQYSDLAQNRSHIVIEESCNDAEVLGNTAGLTQVLSNLLTNAVKFVPRERPPQVHVTCEDKGDRIRVTIVDNGIGIPAEHQEKIFGLFQRLHTTAYPGTGIGLPIVRKAVERMGGTMGLASNPGNGSRFWIELQKASHQTQT
jgi:PAS domain S-box-containing protein